MALGLSVFPLYAAQQDESDPDDESEPSSTELDRITVTGTRIKRVDVEGALPVTVIDREAIELSGESSAADLLRNQSFNSFGSFRAQSGTNTQGASEIDLRGIGSGRSLVLIDGRRIPKNPTSTVGQDLSTIPLGAIERIEILSDGASAIYGSDAIGGVINVITRKDFQGAELMIGGATIDAGNGEREMGSILFGASRGSTTLMGGVSWNGRDISFVRDFDFEELDGQSFFSNNFSTVDPEFGDNFNFTAIPGGCNDSDAFFLLEDRFSLSGVRCAYNFALVAADEASTHNRSLFLRGTHELNSDWQVWLNTDASMSYSFGRYAPFPDGSFFYGTPLAVDSPNNPTNPASSLYDPAFGPNVPVNWWHRFDSIGPRDSEQDTKVYTMQFGATGWIGNAEVEFGLSRVKNKTYALSQNLLRGELASQLVGDGTYDLGDPDGNPRSVLLRMKKAGNEVFVYDQDEYFASIAWDLFETDTGPVQWFLGAEQREERYRAELDYFEIQSYGFNRDVNSVFFESLAMLSENIELSVAGRYDDYSDYGNDFSPKVALRWRVNDQLVTRMSWGEGFRAPELEISAAPLNSGITVVRDPQSCIAIGRDEECFFAVPVDTIISPVFTSEKSTQYSLGFAWQPSDWFSGSVDYYRIELDQAIGFFDSGDLLDRDIAGDPLPPGLGVERDPASGLLLNFTEGFSNLGGVDTSGIDLNAQFTFELGPGRLNSNFQLSYVFDYEVTVDETQIPRNEVGDPGRPEARATISNSYEWGDFGFAWNVNYIADTYDEIVDGVGEGHVPTWVTHDLQVNYFTSWDGKVTLGAQNVLNRLPPLYVGDTFVRNYDFDLFNGFGRILYFRYTQTY